MTSLLVGQSLETLQILVGDIDTILIALTATSGDAFSRLAFARVDSRDGGTLSDDLIRLELPVLLAVVCLDGSFSGDIKGEELLGGPFGEDTTVLQHVSSALPARVVVMASARRRDMTAYPWMISPRMSSRPVWT